RRYAKRLLGLDSTRACVKATTAPYPTRWLESDALARQTHPRTRRVRRQTQVRANPASVDVPVIWDWPERLAKAHLGHLLRRQRKPPFPDGRRIRPITVN